MEDYEHSSETEYNEVNPVTVLIILTVGIVLFCGCSIFWFIRYKRSLIEELEDLTESEEKFLELRRLRNQLKRATKKPDPEDPGKADRLTALLAETKLKFLNEFMGLLEIVDYSKENNKMDIEDCQICQEPYIEGE
jgi:hypothetical protein